MAYDRRGYQGSRGGGVVDLGGHVADLAGHRRRQARSGADGPVVAVGHSLGGDVVIGAALADPGAFDAVGAYEPPMPWLGFRRTDGPERPGAVAPGVRRPGRRGRAVLLPDGQPGGLVPPDRGGPGGAAGRRTGSDRRPAQLPARGARRST